MMEGVLGMTPPDALAGGRRGGVMGKDEFLRLLVAQLRHQDPLNPMRGEEFAAQLAQFSSLEQLIQINEKLGKQEAADAASVTILNATAALGLLGREILAAGDTLVLSGTGGERVTVGVGGQGGYGILKVLDENGKELGRQDLGWLSPGRNEILLGEASSGLSAGRYRYEVVVMSSEGERVPVQTFSRLVVDGIRYGPQGPVLLAGGVEIPLSGVVEVITRSQDA